MRFDFSPGRDCRVKVLPEIADYSIARLEGRNGIGKTMAIRLLQLCTGDQPYRHRETAVWEQLREALGTITIRCTDLPGSQSIEWQVNSSLWPAEPDASVPLLGSEGTPGICKAVTINGQSADLSSVQDLLRVYRLAGDETLAQAITAEVSSLRSLAEAERAEVDSRRATVEGTLRSLRELLQAASPLTVRAVDETLTKAKLELSEASTSLKEADARREELRGLSLRKQELAVLLEQHDDPEAYAEELQRKLQSIRVEQETVRTERDSLNLEAGGDAAKLEQIESLEKKLDEVRRDRDELLDQAHDQTVKLDLLAVPAGANEPSLKGPEGEAEANLAELRALQANIDAGPQIHSLGERIVGILAEESTAPIREQPLATLRSETRLSARELEAAIAARQAEIEEESRPPQAERIAEQIAQVEETLADFAALATVLRKVKRRESLLARTRVELGELAASLAGVEGERFAELESRHQELAQQESDYEAERMRLVGQMAQIAGGSSPGTLRERLESRLKAAATNSDSLATDLFEQTRLVGELHKAQEQATLEVESAAAALSAAEAAQREALAQLLAADRWERLRAQDLLPLPALDETTNIARIETLTGRCQASEEALDVVSSLVADRILAGIVAADRPELPENESARKVLALLAERLGRRYFGNDAVADALFDGGRLIRFDLVEQTVEWQPETGEPIVRHLDAFSSGERAFAYTKTRLERLREAPVSRYRFVALDEFGAFLERSRLELLEHYLANEVVGEFVNQALIVLPLSRSRAEVPEPFVFRPYKP
jgi:hypothetical protein